MTREARYDDIADFYDSTVGDDVSDPVAEELLGLLPELDGLRVLDLACGQGRLARELARRGARVTGADLSSTLLAKARAAEHAAPLGIQYVEADVASSETLVGETFDGIVCHFGLSDIDDLAGCLASVSRLLGAGDWFVFSILHPCFPGWGPDAPSSWPVGRGYFAEGWWLAENPGFRGKVGANHRMLSTYLNGLIEHGLMLEHASEPQPAGDWLRSKPDEDLVPVYFVARCRHTLQEERSDSGALQSWSS